MPGKRSAREFRPKAVVVSAKQERRRYGPLPKLEPTVEIPYANTRGDAPTPAQVVRAMLDSPAWQAVMQPVLDDYERKRQERKKVKPAYTTTELESVFLFQFVAGIETVRETRAHLTSHLGAEARRLLGFDKPRQSKGQVTQIHSVPSEATLSRHRLAFAPPEAGRVAPAKPPEVAAASGPTVYELKKAEVERQRAAISVRRDLYRRFLAQWVADYLKTPQGDEAARALFVDGTTLNSYFDCLITDDGVPQNDEPREHKRCRVKPIFDDRGRMVWDGLLSEAQWEALRQQEPSFRRYWKYSADGGYLALDAGENRHGHGYSIVSAVDSVGMPLDFAAGAIQAGERARALELFAKLPAHLAHLPVDENVRVVSADAGFTGHDVRDAIRDLGLLENIHPVSGFNEARSVAHAARRAASRRRIAHKESGRETWLTDGHCNLFCECGAGEVQKRFRRDRSGRLIPSLEGTCPTCGPITVTSGHWKYRGKKWVHRAKHPGGEPDLQMGNPLTFNNPISKEYARRRFAVHEGVHSILANRFGLLRGRQRVKYLEEVELRTAMTFCALHGIAYTRAKLAQAPQAPAIKVAA